jgi:hypothetical protein
LEKYHVLHTSIKIKGENQKVGQDVLEIEEIPRAMEVDASEQYLLLNNEIG